MKYSCTNAAGDVVDTDPIENGNLQHTLLIGGQWADLPGPGIDPSTTKMHLNMTCTWTIEADANNDIQIYLSKHNLHKPSSGNCDSHTESTEIINDENDASDKLCGELDYPENYRTVHAERATIKLTIGGQTLSRSHDILMWQIPPQVKKRSADVDPTVGSKRRLPKKLSVSEEEKDRQREIISVLIIFLSCTGIRNHRNGEILRVRQQQKKTVHRLRSKAIR